MFDGLSAQSSSSSPETWYDLRRVEEKDQLCQVLPVLFQTYGMHSSAILPWSEQGSSF